MIPAFQGTYLRLVSKLVNSRYFLISSMKEVSTHLIQAHTCVEIKSEGAGEASQGE